MNTPNHKHQNLFLLVIDLLIRSSETKQPVDYVDPFICTQDDHGHRHPAAKVPFGMIKPGPHTYPGRLTADRDFTQGGYNFA